MEQEKNADLRYIMAGSLAHGGDMEIFLNVSNDLGNLRSFPDGVVQVSLWFLLLLRVKCQRKEIR